MSRVGDRIPADIRKVVIERAENRCEYCLMPDDDELNNYTHHIDHIRSLKHRGTSNLDNLAYACMLCNAAKGADIGTTHDECGDFVYFFNPRKDNWSDHFELVDSVIESRTATGWVITLMLRFNTPERIEARRLIF